LLYTTGGKLELKKCFYYPILWHFDDEGIPSLMDFEEDQPITIISSENQAPVTISKKITDLVPQNIGNNGEPFW